MNKCNEIAANEFLRRAHLYGLKEKDEEIRRFYINYVNGCHDGNGENTPGNVFSNLMSVYYQLKGSFDAVDDILLLSQINGLSDLNEKISKIQRQLKYYENRLNKIQNQNSEKQGKTSKAGRKKCDKTYYLDKIESSNRELNQLKGLRILLEKKENKKQLQHNATACTTQEEKTIVNEEEKGDNQDEKYNEIEKVIDIEEEDLNGMDDIEDFIDIEDIEEDKEDDEEDDGKEVIDITDNTNDNNEHKDEGTNNEKQSKRGKKSGKRDDEWRNYNYLYDFEEMINTLIVKENRNKENVAILRDMVNSVLCIPASEAVCERFFRNMSLRVKKQYVTNLKCNKACMITYLNSNCSLVYKIHKTNGKGEYF